MLVSLGELHDSEGDFETRLRRGYVRRFFGVSNDPGDREPDVSASPLCPKVGQIDPYDLGARISKVQIRTLRGSQAGWEITVHSSTEVEPPDRHPLAEPARVTWASEQAEAYTTRDNRGRPVLNTAKDLQLVAIESSRWVVSVSKNLAQVPQALLSFNNAINNGLVVVDGVPFARRTLMCKQVGIGDWQEAEVNDRTIRFRAVSFQLHFRPETWRVKHPNVGFHEFVDKFAPLRDRTTGKLVRESGVVRYGTVRQKYKITVGDPPEPPSEPQPLDRQGRWIKEPTNDNVIHLDVDVYRELNFNLLPLR